jgi:RNA polymerase sigma-70 factor (ECF subfamily)
MESTNPRNAPDPARHEEFVRLFGLNQGRVFGFLLTMLPNYADAEEVLQQTSLILWQKFNEFETNRDFVRWACGIAYRESLAFMRASQRTLSTADESLLEQLAADRLDRGEVLDHRRVALDACLKKLTTRDRQIVEVYYFGEQPTVGQVASQLGRPADTIYKALKRIRTALHDCINRNIAAEDRS